MKVSAKLTAKGQLTLPVSVRHALRVGTGDRIVFELDGSGGGRFSAEPHSVPAFGILNSGGAKSKRPVSVEEMDRGIARHLSGKYRRK